MSKRVYASVDSLIGGMNAAVSPHALPDTQFARGINVDVRGGYARTRHGFHLVSAELAAVLTGAETFQGADRWRTPAGDYLVMVFSGQVYLMLVSTGALTVLGPYMATTDQIHMVQADEYLCIMDGTNLLVLEWKDDAPSVLKTTLLPDTLADDSWDPEWQGIALAALIDEQMNSDTGITYAAALATVLATLTPSNFPVGTIAYYAHGRIHMVSTTMDKRYFLSSDILKPSDPSSVLQWWENSYLNSGGGMGLPEEMGEMRGMSVMRQTNAAASGQGALIVFAQDGVAAFNVYLPRAGTFDISVSADSAATVETFVKPRLLTAGWKDQKIAQVLFYGGGTESPWSITNVNGDIFYRSQDGWRTLKQTATAAAGSLVANAPRSAEVLPFMELDTTPDLQAWISSALQDHRLFMTAKGDADHGHAGLVVFDSNTLTTLGNDPLAAFDGLWTGLNITKLVKTSGGLMAIADDGRVYSLSTSRYDLKGTTASPIECQLVTKQMSYQLSSTSSASGVMKSLDYVDLWVTDLQGEVDITVYFRPDNHPYWTPMPMKTLSVPAGGPPEERRRLRFIPCPTTASAAVSAEGGSMIQGETFQFLIIWNGQMTLRRLYTEAVTMTEAPPQLTSDPRCSIISQQPDQISQNDFSYQVT